VHLSSSLDCIASLPAPQDLTRVQRDLDPAWIEAALQATGTATLRKRRLPAEQVVWLVIGLWTTIPDRSLTINDRNFLSADALISLHGAGTDRHWLVPAKRNSKWRRLKRFGSKDELVEMNVSGVARRKNPSLPKTWTARAIRYLRKGFRPRTLLTSLLDPDQYPAAEIVQLYHERWELELGIGEVKTDMLEATHQPLRSKTPERLRQEVWGILLAYNLIRLEMERIADEAGVAPTRISFVMAAHQICLELLGYAFAAPGAIPKRLRKLRADVKRFILPPRSSERSYPRAVKVKMSSYPKKRRPTAKKAPRNRSR